MTGQIVNPFASEGAAARYERGRPDYSPHARRTTRALLRSQGVVSPFQRALDVACGTGISTRALQPLALATVGIDASAPMIQLASQREGASYVRARAEALPFSVGVFDLVAVGSAIHWLDPEAFRTELNRVAMPGAWLLIHGHRWTGVLAADDRFRAWMIDRYLTRYPPPPRHRGYRPPADYGAWRHRTWERYEHQVEMTSDRLVDYLTTQSNILTVIESGAEPEADIRGWLRSELDPFFSERPVGSFTMDGYVALHRR